VRPLGYAMKAFDLGGRGRVMPTEILSNTGANLVSYGVQAEDGTLYVTLINKEHGTSAKDATVALAGLDGYAAGQMMFLAAPDGDVATKSGITLGGAEIKPDATWTGTWTTALKLEKQTGFVRVPAATAAIVRLTK